MAETMKDSGPAFPHWDGPSGNCYNGISMRDYFAAKASEDDILEFIPATVGDAQKFKEQHGFEPTRQWARYQHADAMLKARENP